MAKRGKSENALAPLGKSSGRGTPVFQKGLHYLVHNGRKKVWLILILLTFTMLVSWRPITTQGLSLPPTNWHQVNEDGFFGYLPTGGNTLLFVFGENLYAYNEHGLFQMDDPICSVWKKVPTPVSPNKSWDFYPLGNYLYLSDGSKKQLWWIKEGTSFTSANWKLVTSKGLPGGVSPTPMTIFKGQQIYGWYYDDVQSGTFAIWRSQDIGKAVMNWTKVVTNSFGDPKNNAFGIAFITVFNNRIYAGTDTLKSASFGDWRGSVSGGVEIWESTTGDPGTWTQVNVDGFGTAIPHTAPKSGKIYTNQIIGTWGVYKGPNQTQEYLYIGTKSHWGGEVWRYDGKGKGGWKNVTPPWAGPGAMLPSWSKRFESMAVFQGNLYLSEGYDTGILAKYDGKKWSYVVTPPPFDPQNTGLASLAVLKDKLYVSTYTPYYATKGDQVWGYPFLVWKYACVDFFWLERFTMTMIDPSLFKLTTTIKNGGPKPIPIEGEEEYLISAYLDGELIYNEVGPPLAPDEEAEIVISHDASEGDHEITLIADAENQIDETDEENNVLSFSFTVPPEEAQDREWVSILLIIGLLALTAWIVWRLGIGRRRRQ